MAFETSKCRLSSRRAASDTIQASQFLMKMANDVVAVEKPKGKTEITSKSLRLDATAPTFYPTRHKLKMPHIDYSP